MADWQIAEICRLLVTQVVPMNPLLHPFHCSSVFSITEEKEFSLIIDFRSVRHVFGTCAS